MKFAKLHGLGNDFLIAKPGKFEDRPLIFAALAKKICDRHCGVGADGILFYQPTSGDPAADFSVLIFNADGSKAEISGNGVRCLAAFLHYTGEHSLRVVRVRTVAGIKVLTLEKREGGAFVFRSSMGQPITEPARIPSRLADGPGPILGFPLEVGSQSVEVTVTSLGNPHCSTFWPELARAPIERLGPALERHPCFPNRTNVEFIQVLDPHNLRVSFWERGVGRTLASGTGSSAAAAAAILNGLAQSPVTVETDLGTLLVEWTPGSELFLTGQAEFICSGDYPNSGGSSEPS